MSHRSESPDFAARRHAESNIHAPLTSTTALQAPATQAGTPPISGDAAPTRTVLVIDDDLANRALIVTLVEHRGYVALQASDGAEGLALTRDRHPDLVISDILMPTMDGFEFVRQLRADPAIASIEVIFYTAHYHERQARNLAKSCGVSRVLVKPCEPQDILQAIDQSLAHTLPLARDLDVASEPDAPSFDREHLRLMTDKLSEKIDKLEATNQRMAALNELNLYLASERDPLALLEQFCRGARNLVGATYAVLAVNHTHQADVISFTSGIEAAKLLTLDRPHLYQGLVGHVYAHRQAQRSTGPGMQTLDVGLPAAYPPICSALIAPIVSLQRTYGWICLANKLGADGFSAEDEHIVSIMAAQVGRIYENGSLYGDMKRHAEHLEFEINERQRASDKLRASEAGLHRAELLAKLTHVITGPDGTLESWGDSMPRMVHIDPSAVFRTTAEWLARVHPEDREVFRRKALEASAKGVRTDFEYRMLHGDNSWIYLRQVMEPLEDTDRNAGRRRWFNTIQDISEQKRAEFHLRESEERLRRVNRVYAVLSGINTLIVRVRDRTELFRESCRIAVEHGHFRMAMVGLVDRPARVVVPVASAGIDMGFFQRKDTTLSLRDDAPSGHGAITGAVRERKPIVIGNIETETRPLLARSLLVSQGIRSMVCLPLSVGGEVTGVLALYADEADFFDTAEMKLLEELADDIAFAMDHIDKVDRLDYLAFYDELTALPNRNLLTDRCTQDIAAAQKEAQPVTVLVMGLDQFKLVGDTLGHAVSDQVLKEFAGRVTAALREQDTAARVDKDEFVIVLPGSSAEDASLQAIRFQQLVSRPYRFEDTEVNITTSVGIANFPGDGADFDALFNSAQVAMQRAKENGHGNCQFFSADMFESMRAQALLVSELRNAVARQQFTLHYQPFADMQSGRIGGMEALLRWNSPVLGAVSPARFIPVAEQSGLIAEIGAWVLQQACRDIRDWLDRGIHTPAVSVNISPIQFRDPGLLQQIESTLRDFAVEPSMICIEVTEGALMKDVAHSEALLRSLKGLGVKLSLDDFGTGYSSLSYLKLFPFDKVKIDQSFVRGIGTNVQDAVITKVVISMAHGLGLRVIAEGVETEAQCEFLRANMSDEIQGYFFSRPVPKAAVEELLLNDRRLPAHLLRQHDRVRTLLLVDDEPNVITSLKRLLRRDGYQILTAASGTEGMELLTRYPVDIIVSDQRMPGMTGVEFLTRAKALYPDTIRIVLSGYTELKSVTDAINEGAVYRFLTKPWDDGQLRTFIREAFEHKELADENKQLDLKIRTANLELEARNRQLQELLDRKKRAMRLHEQSLNLVREALHCIPLPVIGLDDEGQIVFINERAIALLPGGESLLGQEIAVCLPAIDAAINAAPSGKVSTAEVHGRLYRLQWQQMGSDTSNGRIVTLTHHEADIGA